MWVLVYWDEWQGDEEHVAFGPTGRPDLLASYSCRLDYRYQRKAVVPLLGGFLLKMTVGEARRLADGENEDE